MNSFLAVLKKDLQRNWILMLAAALTWAACLATALFYEANPEPNPQPLRISLLTVGILARYVLVVVVAVVVVQTDLIMDDRAAWRTRPIGRTTLLLSKVVALTLGLVVPSVLLDTLARLLLSTSLVEAIVASAATGMLLLAALLFVALISALTRSLTQFVLLTCAIGVALTIAAFSTSAGNTPNMKLQVDGIAIPITRVLSPSYHDYVSPATTWLVSTCFFLLAGSLSLVITFSTGRRMIAFATGVLTYGIAIMAPDFWRWDLVNEVNTAPSSAPSPSSATVTSDGKAKSQLWSDLSTSIVNYTLRIDGLAAGWTMDWHGAAMRIQGSTNQTFLGGAFGTGSDLRAAASAAARAILSREERTTVLVPGLLSLPHSEREALGGRTARIEGLIRVEPRLFQIVHRLPLTPGAQREKSGSRWRIVTTKKYPLEGRSSTGMGLWSVTVDAIIGTNPASRPEEFQMVLVNEPRQEMALPALNLKSTSLETGVLRIQRTEVAFARDYRVFPDLYGGARHELDEEWIKGATLIILSSSPGPAFTVPLRDDEATFDSLPAR
jgi:hypothetical protein